MAHNLDVPAGKRRYWPPWAVVVVRDLDDVPDVIQFFESPKEEDQLRCLEPQEHFSPDAKKAQPMMRLPVFRAVVAIGCCLQFCGCVTASRYQNVAQPNSAQVWLGQDGGKDLWSPTPGNSDLVVYQLDGVVAGFPPTHFAGWNPDHAKPLYLAPGAHSVFLNLEHNFPVQASPTSSGTAVEVAGSGTITADFPSGGQYRITAFWRDGRFAVTLWDITDGMMPGSPKQMWDFAGPQNLGTAQLRSPTAIMCPRTMKKEPNQSPEPTRQAGGSS